jgi:hypothetical protein
MMVSQFFEIVKVFITGKIPFLVLLIGITSLCFWLTLRIAKKIRSIGFLALSFLIVTLLATYSLQEQANFFVIVFMCCATVSFGFDLYRRLVDPIERY